MTTSVYLSADDIRAIYAEVDALDHLAPSAVDYAISERIGHTSVTCLNCAVECAYENRAETGASDDLYEVTAEAVSYLAEQIASCYCEEN